jgi:hypothetical protein
MKYYTLPKNIVLDECIAIEFLICVDTVRSEGSNSGSVTTTKLHIVDSSSNR